MKAFPIQPIAETADSVTLSRRDFESLVDLVTDATDLADIDAVKRRITVGETQIFPFALAERLLEGHHPVTVFREFRGLGLRQLAAKAEVSPSYLSEIETGQKPGSLACIRRLAAVLEVSMDLLAGNGASPSEFPTNP
jgi:hypothetical protein